MKHVDRVVTTHALLCTRTPRPAPGGTGWMSRYKWFQTASGFKMLFIFCSNYKNNTLSEQITENTNIHQGKRGGPRLPPPRAARVVPAPTAGGGGRDPGSAPRARPTHEPPPEPRGCRRGHPHSCSEGRQLTEENAHPAPRGLQPRVPEPEDSLPRRWEGLGKLERTPAHPFIPPTPCFQIRSDGSGGASGPGRPGHCSHR